MLTSGRELVTRTLICVTLIAVGLASCGTEEEKMTTEALNPFAEIESVLADPPATGMFVTFVTPGAPAEKAGLGAGDTVVAVGDVGDLTLQSFYQALQPTEEGDTSRLLKVRRPDGAKEEIGITVPLRGYSACPVIAGKCAWEDLPDTDYEPDFTGLTDGTEIWLRNSLGEERAGFERLLIKRDGDFIDVDTLFRLGGEHEGETWDYRTHSVARHRLDRFLSLVKTTFHEGSPGEEKLQGACELGDDGIWRGVRGTPDGKEEPVEHRPVSLHGLNSYDVTLLPLTMPLAEGARVTYCAAGEGTGYVTGRGRMECTGKETVDIDGTQIEAWRFEQRHYGETGVSEKFYVTEDRVLVRIDWGPNYGGCWAVNVGKEHVLDGVPEHVKVE